MVLKENEDEAMFSRHLSMIKKDVDVAIKIDDAKFDFNNRDKVLQFFKDKGFSSLVAKLNVYNQESYQKQKSNTKENIAIKEIDN
jgi:DNA polymerase-1